MSLEKGSIALRQFTLLIIIITIGDAVLIVPSFLAPEAGRDAWLAAILSLSLGAPVVFLLYHLASRFPAMTLVEYSELIIGKWLGRILASVYLFVIFFLTCTFFLREIGDFIATEIMMETPIQATMILFMVVVVFAVRLGLETIARAAEIFIPWIIGLFIIFTLLILPEIDLQNLQPVLENGIKPLMRASYTNMAIPYMELTAFLMIFPFLNEKPRVKKYFYLGVLIGGSFIIIITFMSITVLGEVMSAQSNYISYQLAKEISIGDFLERLEIIIAIVWLLTIFFKLAIYFYALVLGTAQLLRLKDYRPLTLPMGMILVVGSIIITPNILHYNYFTVRIWPLVDYIFCIGVPLLLLTVYKFRKELKNN